jgi:hypothetical protein
VGDRAGFSPTIAKVVQCNTVVVLPIGADWRLLLAYRRLASRRQPFLMRCQTSRSLKLSEVKLPSAPKGLGREERRLEIGDLDLRQQERECKAERLVRFGILPVDSAL